MFDLHVHTTASDGDLDAKGIITCGSDYHGITIKPEIELGKGKNCNLPIYDTSIFDKFYKELKKNFCT